MLHSLQRPLRNGRGSYEFLLRLLAAAPPAVFFLWILEKKKSFLSALWSLREALNNTQDQYSDIFLLDSFFSPDFVCFLDVHFGALEPTLGTTRTLEIHQKGQTTLWIIHLLTSIALKSSSAPESAKLLNTSEILDRREKSYILQTLPGSTLPLTTSPPFW